MEGARTIQIYGVDYPVRAQIHTIEDFSAHGDYNEILRWLQGFQAPPVKTFLVHGEPLAIVGMRDHIRERHPTWEVAVPKYLENFEL